jgi:murein DD-endopeptidase MepM/ murein hydrolase activator NlpD
VAGAPPHGSPAAGSHGAAAISFGAGADGPDPYGWRALSRDSGDAVVGPGGVLTSPLDAALARRADATGLALVGAAGSAVRAPAGLFALPLDHGNGWSTLLAGLGGTTVAVGDRVQRG